MTEKAGRGRGRRIVRPTRLYHFTCRAWWHYIEQDGITRGEVPLNARRIDQYPNLTTDPEPAHQAWWHGSLFNKAAVRITIEVSPYDEKLVSWVELTRKYGMDDRLFRRLNRSGGGGARNWWIYRGIVRPESFVAVDFLDDGIIRPEEQSFLDIARRSSSRAEALKEFGAFSIGSWVGVKNVDLRSRMRTPHQIPVSACLV